MSRPAVFCVAAALFAASPAAAQAPPAPEPPAAAKPAVANPAPGKDPGAAPALLDEFAPAAEAAEPPAGARNPAVRAQAGGNYPGLDRMPAPVGQIQEAWNEARPAPGQHTPGVLRVTHRDDRVIAIRTRDYMVTVIYLSPWEQIRDYYLGDNRVFRVEYDPRRPNVVRVHHANPGADSNLTLITASGRVISFYLRSEGWNTGSVTDLTVFVDTPSRPAAAQIWRGADPLPGAKPAAANPAAAPPVKAAARPERPDYLRAIPFDINKLRFGDYELRAPRTQDAEIAPARVFHDGTFTFLDFGEKADRIERPVVHQVVDRVDTPVNTRTEGPEGNIMVVEAIGDFTLRAGEKVVCVDYVGPDFHRAKPVRQTASLFGTLFGGAGRADPGR